MYKTPKTSQCDKGRDCNSAYNETTGGEASSFYSRRIEWSDLTYFSAHCGRGTRYFCPRVIFHSVHHALHFILSFIAIFGVLCFIDAPERNLWPMCGKMLAPFILLLEFDW